MARARGKPSKRPGPKSRTKSAEVAENENNHVEDDAESDASDKVEVSKNSTPKRSAAAKKSYAEIDDVDEEEDAEKPKKASTSSKPKAKGQKASTSSARGAAKKPVGVEEEEGSEEEEEKVSTKANKKGKPTAKVTAKRGRPKTSAPASKKPKKEESEDDEEEEKEYEVERIMEVKYMKNGRREFLIKWKGYGQQENTWEPEEHLECKELLESFTQKLEGLKSKNEPDLRVARKQTQRYADSCRNQGVRNSRRFTSKPRMTYHGLED